MEVLRAHVRDEGLPRIAFRCSSYHQNSALYPVIAHVEQLLDFQREDTPESKLDKLERGLQPYSSPLEEEVPLFASLLSVPLDNRYPALTLNPQRQKPRRVVLTLGQSEKLLPQFLRSWQQPLHMIKPVQAPQHGEELGCPLHLLTELSGSRIHLFYLWGCIAFGGHQHRTEGHLEVEFTLDARRCLGECGQQLQAFRQMLNCFLVGRALDSSLASLLPVALGPAGGQRGLCPLPDAYVLKRTRP